MFSTIYVLTWLAVCSHFTLYYSTASGDYVEAENPYFLQPQSRQHFTKHQRSSNSISKHDEDIKAILEGVDTVYLSGSGFMSVFGSTAFPILTGLRKSSSDLTLQAIAAGSRYGKGAMIGAGSLSLITPEEPYPENQIVEEVSGRNRFILNSINWVRSSSTQTETGTSEIRVAFLVGIRGDASAYFKFQKFTSPYNITSSRIYLSDLEKSDSNKLLDQYDVMVTRDFFDASNVQILKEFIQGGGGFICNINSWAWKGYVTVSGHFGENFPLNTLSYPMGFVWHDGGGVSSNTDVTNVYNTSTALLDSIHVSDCIEEIKPYFTNRREIDRKIPPRQLFWILIIGVAIIPPSSDFYRKDFYSQMLYLTQPVWQGNPNPTKPVSDPDDKFVFSVFHNLCKYLDPIDVPAHPSSQYFPGAIESLNIIGDYIEGDFSKDLKTFQFTTEHVGWVSTGLYAPAGEMIDVKILTPNGEVLTGYEVQIGCHTDDLFGKEKWYRIPWAKWSQKIVENKAKLTSPYGGLMYIVVPNNALYSETPYTVEVMGCVEAPMFKLGQTSNLEWQERIRYSSGPWAELVTDKVVITVRSSAIRTLDNPQELLELWDRVLDACADLGGTSRIRRRPERIVEDVQISAGSLHSGYPIMSYYDSGAYAVDITRMRSVSWGHFHELGHNHQRGDWTWGGTGEVTCNIFAVYICESVLNVPEIRSSTNLTPERNLKRIQNYITNGKNYSQWKGDPWLALNCFLQLKANFGWDAYITVFSKYLLFSSSEKPKTDQDKIDMFMVTFSSVIEKDLSGFFQSWGIFVSDGAINKTSAYPQAGIAIEDMLQGKVIR